MPWWGWVLVAVPTALLCGAVWLLLTFANGFGGYRR